MAQLVEYGVLQPRGDEMENWQFRATALARVRCAQRLRRDLGVDLPGLALSLDLLEELDRLRREVGALRRQIGRLIDDRGFQD